MADAAALRNQGCPDRLGKRSVVEELAQPRPPFFVIPQKTPPAHPCRPVSRPSIRLTHRHSEPAERREADLPLSTTSPNQRHHGCVNPNLRNSLRTENLHDCQLRPSLKRSLRPVRNGSTNSSNVADGIGSEGS